MTLTTTIALSRPIALSKPADSADLWALMCELVGSPEGVPAEFSWGDGWERLETPTDIGLLARLQLRWGESDPVVIEEELDVDECSLPPWNNRAWAVLSFDTSSNPNALNLHAWLVMQIHKWASQSMLSFAWLNELRGMWALGTAGLSDFGDWRCGDPRSYKELRLRSGDSE